MHRSSTSSPCRAVVRTLIYDWRSHIVSFSVAQILLYTYYPMKTRSIIALHTFVKQCSLNLSKISQEDVQELRVSQIAHGWCTDRSSSRKGKRRVTSPSGSRPSLVHKLIMLDTQRSGSVPFFTEKIVQIYIENSIWS